MPVLTSITPPDGAIEISANRPFVAQISANPGSNQHVITETTHADFAAGTLTNVEARADGSLALLGVHRDDFEAHQTGNPPTGWTASGGGSFTVEHDGSSKVLRLNLTSGNFFAIWDAPETGTNVNVYGEFFALNSFSHWHGLLARYTNTNNWYLAEVTNNTAKIGKTVGGTWTSIATASINLSTNTWYSMRFEVVGSTLRMRVWPRNGTEPSAWTISLTDTSLSGPGKVGVKTWTSSAVTSRVDNLVVIGCSGAGKVYQYSGLRESPSYNISSSVGVFSESRISWAATVPSDTTLTMEARVNGGAYEVCTNGGRIPGVVAGASAVSVQLRMSLATTDGSKTPVIDDITLEFFGVDPARVEIVVNGISSTVANGRLEFWGHKRITGGVIVDDFTSIFVRTRGAWSDMSFRPVPVIVRYDGSALATITVRGAEYEGDPAGTRGLYETWATTPDWHAGRAGGYYFVLDYYIEAAEKSGYYYVLPPSESALDGWYLVGRYMVTDGTSAAVIGRRAITDGAAAAVVRGWSTTAMPAAGLVQAWLYADGPAAGLPATVTLGDWGAAAVVGAMTTTTGAAAAIVYTVNRRTHVEIRSVSPDTAAVLEALGVARA